jgi:hypothetical protein
MYRQWRKTVRCLVSRPQALRPIRIHEPEEEHGSEQQQAEGQALATATPRRPLEGVVVDVVRGVPANKRRARGGGGTAKALGARGGHYMSAKEAYE